MFTASRHISDIYTKPLAEDVSTNEHENNGKPKEEITNESLKKATKKPKKVVKFESSKKKFEEAIPTPDITFQMIEKEVKMKQKRETPGKKGELYGICLCIIKYFRILVDRAKFNILNNK